MSKENVSKEIKEVVDTSKEVVDTVAEAAEQTVDAVTEVTPVVVEEQKGFWETTAEIAAHARPIVKKILVGVTLGVVAGLVFNAVSKPAQEEAVAANDHSDENILEGDFTTNEE